jgi:hypothetical protein
MNKISEYAQENWRSETGAKQDTTLMQDEICQQSRMQTRIISHGFHEMIPASILVERKQIATGLNFLGCQSTLDRKDFRVVSIAR